MLLEAALEQLSISPTAPPISDTASPPTTPSKSREPPNLANIPAEIRLEIIKYLLQDAAIIIRPQRILRKRAPPQQPQSQRRTFFTQPTLAVKLCGAEIILACKKFYQEAQPELQQNLTAILQCNGLEEYRAQRLVRTALTKAKNVELCLSLPPPVAHYPNMVKATGYHEKYHVRQEAGVVIVEQSRALRSTELPMTIACIHLVLRDKASKSSLRLARREWNHLIGVGQLERVLAAALMLGPNAPDVKIYRRTRLYPIKTHHDCPYGLFLVSLLVNLLRAY